MGINSTKRRSKHFAGALKNHRMEVRMKRRCCIILACGWLGTMVMAENITYIDLVKRLTDLERLAVLPSPGDTCGQWSSYDRKSCLDVGTGKYKGWSANDDGSGIIRKEGNFSVLAEMEGPGCIWRIWSALPEILNGHVPNGHVKIYLDGNAAPILDLPFIGYFDRNNPPLNYSSLVYNAASGYNCYVPIPYQKSCKILAEDNWGAYYHFTYQTFPKGTVIPTFRRDLSPSEKAAMENVDLFLNQKMGTDPAGKREGEVTETKPITIPASNAVSVAVIKGPRAITALRIRLDSKTMEKESRDLAKMLREVILQISWDGETSPSVWSPLGDFFGTATGANPYRSLPMGLIQDKDSSSYEWYSYWYMPFAREARLELKNEGAQNVALEATLVHAPLSRPIETLGRFHAKWHRDAFLPVEPERDIDWTMLKTEGRGRFCGVMLHVWNLQVGWWGEGDEKFFVDGEKFPSTFGTGSEDYFGYANSKPTCFQRPFHNQTFNSGGNKGHISVNRWQVADNVPFQKSFEGAIEKYDSNSKILYACIPYWYLEAGATDAYKPVSVTRRIAYYDYANKRNIKKVDNVLEGEQLKICKSSAGKTENQDMSFLGNDWSGGYQLLWMTSPEEQMVLQVPVKTTGKYDVRVCMTRDRDYGIVRLLLDDLPIGAPIDLYAPAVTPPTEISLGTMDITAGDHKLTMEIVGSNEHAYKFYKVGLDYIKLQPVTQ